MVITKRGRREEEYNGSVVNVKMVKLSLVTGKIKKQHFDKKQQLKNNNHEQRTTHYRRS